MNAMITAAARPSKRILRCIGLILNFYDFNERVRWFIAVQHVAMTRETQADSAEALELVIVIRRRGQYSAMRHGFHGL
jgi:hypothetical protein